VRFSLGVGRRASTGTTKWEIARNHRPTGKLQKSGGKSKKNQEPFAESLLYGPRNEGLVKIGRGFKKLLQKKREINV